MAKGFEKIEKESEVVIKAGAGLSLAKLEKFALDNNLAGCEFLTGIPGNIGGAVFMNTGVRNIKGQSGFVEMKDIISSVKILDLKDNAIKTMDRSEIDFKYRSSGLVDKIILGARIELKKDNRENIQNREGLFIKKREWLAKIGFPNAGSIFKNPEPEKSAGMLIESCGLKGKRIGNAKISMVHANVIVNLGNGSANDVLALIDLARASVKQKFNIDLELELKII